MHPSFGKPSFWIGSDMKVFRPFGVGHRIGIRIGYPGFSSVMELGFVAKATMGTWDMKHKTIFSGRPRPLHVRRSDDPLRIARVRMACSIHAECLLPSCMP